MKHRKLRIAWTVVWGILCLLLIAFWVRSYAVRDSAFWPRNTFGAEINSMNGHIVLFISYQPFTSERFKIRHEAITANDEERVRSGILGFLYQPQPQGSNIHVHFWFLALVATGAVVAPWIHWSRRFTIRSLLISTTLLAVALGLAVWATK